MKISWNHLTPLVRSFPPKTTLLSDHSHQRTSLLSGHSHQRPPLLSSHSYQRPSLVKPLPPKAIPSCQATPIIGHPSDQAQFQMHWDTNILLYCPTLLKRGHPSYKTRFQMHWDTNILLYCLLPLKRTHLSY